MEFLRRTRYILQIFTGVLIFFNLFTVAARAQGSFPFVVSKKAATICFDANEEMVVKIAAQSLKNDVKLVTGITPQLDSSDLLSSYCVIAGTIGKSRFIDELTSNKKLEVTKVKGQWETFSISVIDQPFSNVKQALVIAGSDARGTAFGVFELSKMIGVSPFYWWADIEPKHKEELYVSKSTRIVGPPSVKYRGIFINDEDWGLQPWAAKNFEPETGDIGPKTYAKVFELLLRLKANLIWPAMHPSTKAFYHYPGNPQIAKVYGIIVGSSHAEPMLRNNVGEWNEKTMGHFNYITNKEQVYKYWEDRVKESKGIDAMYTMGMRGVHDSKMEGIKDEKEAVPLLERIIADQRALLKQYWERDVTAIPQVFTAYKEVLDIYDAGLKLPEDITLVWPDDNYGYIQRLNNNDEKLRSGGAGVYYHASYWGRPHDYLWLGSTHPALVREEMMKAYATGASRLWVLNVGDIKPLEYNIQQFMDMAYKAEPFTDSRYVKKHLEVWLSDIFGKQQSQEITGVLWQYYQLAFERRPEFMGWSQTEPTTKTKYTSYNHFSFSDEAQKRIDKYEALERKIRSLKKLVDPANADAFYQLVYYPVICASWMNKKFLYRDKAFIYAKQNRLQAFEYAALSIAVYDSIVKETEYFNQQLSGGKWRGIMSMKPRDLPVFLPPELPVLSIDKTENWNAVPEGYDTIAYKNKADKKLPAFLPGLRQSHFIDIYLSDSVTMEWTAKPSTNWIRLSLQKGRLAPKQHQSSYRVWVSIDWSKISSSQNGSIEILSNGKKQVIGVSALRPSASEFGNYKGFVEHNGLISIHASHYQSKIDKQSNWRMMYGTGHTDSSIVSIIEKNKLTDTALIQQQSGYVTYSFYSFSDAQPKLSVYTLPTHPLNNNYGMRYAISVDDSAPQLISFRTIGRSEEWKQNVLRNAAIKEIELPQLKPGKHTLKIYAIDPGVVLDRILIRLGDLPASYGVIPETWKN